MEMSNEESEISVAAQVYVQDEAGKWRIGSSGDVQNRDRDAQIGLIWIDLSFEQEGVFEWLSEIVGIEPLTCEALLHKGTRPRVAGMTDGLLVILRGVNCNPGHDPEDMVAVRMLFSDHMIITLRKKIVMAVQDIQKLIE